jgi:hypothetical protein
VAAETGRELQGSRPVRRRYGGLGLQIALSLVGVAVGAAIATNIITALTVTSDAHQVLVRQEAEEANAAALGAAVTYTPSGWVGQLAPVIAVATRARSDPGLSATWWRASRQR